MRDAAQLYELQLLDWDIQRREEELSAARARIADDARRELARRRLDALESRRAALESPTRRSEREIERLESRVSAIESRLYSGAVTNPRELEAYQDERAALLEGRAAEEDRLLELMVASEEAQEARDRAAREFERIDAERQAELAEMRSREAELVAELPSLVERRAEMAAEYPPGVLALYETVRRARAGQGAALVDRSGVCQGCRIAVPNSEMGRVRAGDGVVQCGSCTRILIYYA